MVKSPRQHESAPRTSLFPFIPHLLGHRWAGYVLSGIYGILMLWISLKYHVIGDYNVETDFFWGYVPEAKKILQGSILIEDFRGPGYPLLLALVGLLTRDYFHAGIVLSTLAAAATLFFIFEIIKRLFRVDLALLTTLLVATNLTFIQYSYTAGTDMLFTAFVTTAMFLLLAKEEQSWLFLSLAALFSAFAYLTRYNGVFIVPAAAALFFIANPFRQSPRERGKVMATFLGMFFLFIAPWGLYTLSEKGSFFYNKNYLNIAYEMFAKGRIGWDQFWSVEAHKYTSLGQVVLNDPARFLQTIFGNVFDHLARDGTQLLGWPIGLLSGIGLILFFRESRTRRQLAFLLYGTCYFLVLLVVFYGERFSMFLLPLYASFAMKTLTWPKLSSYRFWNRLQIGALVAFALVAWSGWRAYEFNAQNIDSGPKEILAFARWCDSNLPPSERGKNIIARKPHVAYYLDMKMAGFPYVESYDDLKREMKSLDASYLYFSLMEAGMRPQFQYLLDPRRAPPELKPLTYTVSPPAVLYKVERDSL